jgi:hypothetical protein
MTFLKNCFKLKIDLEPLDGKVYSALLLPVFYRLF